MIASRFESHSQASIYVFAVGEKHGVEKVWVQAVGDSGDDLLDMTLSPEEALALRDELTLALALEKLQRKEYGDIHA